MVRRERASVRLLSFLATSLCVLGRRGVILAFKRRSGVQTFIDNQYQPSALRAGRQNKYHFTG